MHAYRVEENHTRVLGVSSAGFERFFQTLGEPTSADTYPATPLGHNDCVLILSADAGG